MRQVKWCLLLLAAVSLGCQPEAATARRQAAMNDRGVEEAKKDAIQTGDDADALLLLLDDEPLALPDDDESPAAAADNSRCHHCHLNYIDEELAVVHARAQIGCADCHGNCDAHIADESWASGGNGTAPGVMYTKEKINPFCLDCHPREKIEKTDKTQHKALFAGTSTEKYCTDCHGDHRLTERKCTWK